MISFLCAHDTTDRQAVQALGLPVRRQTVRTLYEEGPRPGTVTLLFSPAVHCYDDP